MQNVLAAFSINSKAEGARVSNGAEVSKNAIAEARLLPSQIC